MRLIIVRHGESEANLKGILQGHSHGRLTKRGRSQVKRLAYRLKKENIDVIYSSDLGRVLQTTKAISSFHKVPVHYVKALREINLGVHENKPHNVFSYRTESGILKTRLRPEGGESYNDVKRRIKIFTSSLYKNYGAKTVLLSTHGIVIKCIVSIYLGIPLGELAHIWPRNAGILILEVNGPRARAVKVNDDIFPRNKLLKIK